MNTQTAPVSREQLTPEEERSFRPERLRYFVEVVTGPQQGHTHPLVDVAVVVGSGDDCDLRLKDATVSRRHLEFERSASGVWVRDLGSKNGVLFNGARVEGLLVRREAMLVVGTTTLRVACDDAAEQSRGTFGAAVGEAPIMQRLFQQLRRVAPTAANVLLEGETGTGKDVLARALHDASPRRHRPFVVVDCGSLNPTLIESELFGHVRGAFTGAAAERQGAFLSAAGGTVFLDELGELPLALQPRLLRALENRTVRRLGEDRDRPIDVRFVAATHRDLGAAVRQGTFREDLFFRLTVVVARVPPLRERREDLPLLVSTLVQRAGGAGVPLSTTLLQRFAQHDWPGNVRELRNMVERAMHGADPELTTPAIRQTGAADAVPYKEAKEQLMESFTREYFERLFEANRGNVTAMARAAGVARTYAHEIVRKYGLK